MENEIESKTYELGYHLNLSLEEAGVKSNADEISDLIVQNGGSIVKFNEPKKIHLSYPLKHKSYAYFGVIYFKAPAESIEKINAQMKLQNNVLRYLLTKMPEESKELRILGEQRTHRAKKSHEAVAGENKAVKLEEGAIEKEIEEVIKGL